MARKGSEEINYTTADAEVKYYDMLYNFAGVVSKANEQSFEGWEPKMIAKTLRKSSEAFCSLCMIDSMEHKPVEEKTEPSKAVVGNRKDPADSNEQPTAAKEEEGPEALPEKLRPENFLRIENGWGLCPVCSSKVLKVTMTTRLENFPVYCKRCRAEHLVNWWNADHQKILYKRYVNERRLRDNALRGTGLRSYQRSGTSATEREALKV